MTTNTKILIIGAGAIGCATALALAERGVTDMLVVDRGKAGEGSSDKAAGGLRSQFSTELNIRLTQLSLPFFHEIADEIDWREDGYIFLSRSVEKSETDRRNVAFQQSMGVPSEWVSADEIEARFPWLNTEGVVSGTWCPTDAIFDQVKFMQVLAGRARASGAEIREGVNVTALRLEDGRVTGAETSEGFISAETVILATGAWAPELAATIGVDLPVSGMRREIYTFGPVPGLPDDMPFVGDFDIGSYIRRDEQGFRVSGKLGAELDHDAPVSAEHAEAALAWATTLMPMLGGAQHTGGWAGLTEMTPDHHALLGTMPGIEGLVIATGFSGHGVMHAPVTGQLIAEMLLDGGAHTLDISALAPARFAEGHPLTETIFARPSN